MSKYINERWIIDIIRSPSIELSRLGIVLEFSRPYGTFGLTRMEVRRND